MKATEIRNMTDQDLVKKLNDLKEELFNLRFQDATGQLENFNSIGTVKQLSLIHISEPTRLL